MLSFARPESREVNSIEANNTRALSRKIDRGRCPLGMK